ncbi:MULTISPECIES: hypothetical protein [unclassified Coleofasciculus]|uniref:hypothetical protein n=1 Tax=unclassified Coleofasciculus TaxID=2692782 RepID=UPI00187FC2BA|nr:MULTISPECIES: hypothetical protein [unclassified Coleofasciculus]MBE9128765.1 hypothetical protein [Coleofasciculus sp. LEGE 07081]MBE9151224.1 hypothetical protein [Coleofasciculus sp. LEGE 07092]
MENNKIPVTRFDFVVPNVGFLRTRKHFPDCPVLHPLAVGTVFEINPNYIND